MDSLLSPLVQVINVLLDIFTLLLIANAVMSFIRPNQNHPVVHFIHRFTEPVLLPIRRVVPPMGGFDFSVLIALVLIQVIRQLLWYGV